LRGRSKFEAKNLQGTENDIEISKNKVVIDNEECFLFMVIDISGIVKSEQLDAMNKAKDQWVATTSHELKTPLNAIIGMHTLLDDMIEETQA
jgi:signal transduction histidine kinase